jgi:hypothetical protein
MTPAVRRAIDEIARQFVDHRLLEAEDQNGGACIIIERVPLGAPYSQADSWLGFHVTHNTPYADVYPHFARGDLARIDAKALGEGMCSGHVFPQPGVVRDATSMPSRPAVQISRRSNRRDSTGLETPLLKLLKVITWLKSR